MTYARFVRCLRSEFKRQSREVMNARAGFGERIVATMKRVLCAIATLLMVTGIQNEGGHSALGFVQDNPTRVIKPVVNKSGWKIPGLEESRITGPRQRLPKGYGPASVPVFVTVYKPTGKFITTIPRYALKDGQTLIVTERKVLIDSIIKCDVDGRVFMYILHCTIILEEPNGRTGYSGMFGVHYSDRDGDGKFESYGDGNPFITPDLHIPDWVLKNQ